MRISLPNMLLGAVLIAGASAPADAQDEPFGVQYARENGAKAHVAVAGKPWRVTAQNSEYDKGRHYWTSYFRLKASKGARYKVTVTSERVGYAPPLVLSTCYSVSGERVDKGNFVPNQSSDNSPVKSVVLTPNASGDFLCSISIDMLWAARAMKDAGEAASPPPYTVTVVPQP